jgi:uncharacterized membrane protein YfhO
MIQMEAKQDKTNPVQDYVARNTEKLISHRIEILRITFNQPKFYEIEIEKMYDEKDQDSPSGPDHEP